MAARRISVHMASITVVLVGHFSIFVLLAVFIQLLLNLGLEKHFVRTIFEVAV